MFSIELCRITQISETENKSPEFFAIMVLGTITNSLSVSIELWKPSMNSNKVTIIEQNGRDDR